MGSIQIPEKTYFKIGEVAKLLDLQPYVLRYWETEFDALAPEKTRSGQRSYRRDDIELLLLVKTLLYDEMYTIAGARRQLKLRKKGMLEAMEPEAVQRVVSERDALRQERDTYLEERPRLEKAVEKLRHEASRLQLQNETLEDENAQLAAAQLEYESSIRRLRDELEARRETVRSLEDSNQSLAQKLQEADERLEEQSGQIEVFGESAVDASELAELRQQRDRSMEQVAELQSQLDTAQAELRAARESLGTTQGRFSELEREVAARQSALEQSGVRIQSLEKSLADAGERTEYEALAREELETKLKGLREALDASTQNVEALRAEKAQLLEEAADTAEIEALERQLAESSAALQRLRDERDQLRQTTDSHADKQRTRWVAMRRELESLASLVH